LALSAPHWQDRGTITRKDLAPLGSATPFSLLNALRGGFSRIADRESAWSASNWRHDKARHAAIAMFDHLPDAARWLDVAARDEPDVVLIGAMTLSLPGAIACARQLRAACPDIVIALGGKHVTETLWANATGTLSTHAGAPIGQDVEGLFDLLVSGDGEDAIAELIEAVARHQRGCGEWWRDLQVSRTRMAGDFVLYRRGEFVSGRSAPRADLPDVYRFFPVGAPFPVLATDRTAHAYSYASKGCIYRCSFCSESSSVNGPVHAQSLELAGKRLAAQFLHLRAQAGAGGYSVSAFVEDSIFLQGYEKAWRSFTQEVERLGATVRFGAQLTVDIILSPSRLPALQDLSRAGMQYVFFGMETADESVAGNMSKNLDRTRSWQDRSLDAIDRLSATGIDAGVSVLFGLGESRQARTEQLDALVRWRERHGQPKVVSLNWAVKHPLRDATAGDGPAFDYRAWGTPSDDPRREHLMQLFGESSILYPLDGIAPPGQDELQEIAEYRLKLRNQQ
jgi:radical SAM superfamily enzyme YgiQ (UPF0313 family)